MEKTTMRANGTAIGRLITGCLLACYLTSFAAAQQLSGGTPTAPVSDAYAKAFLETILPQLSDFITKAGLKLPTPVVTNQLVMTNYICRILNGQPIAQLYLTNGDRFNYRDGYVAAFYAHDAFSKFPEEGRTEDFLGHINMGTNEAIALCEGVMRKLGYVGKFTTPIITYAPARAPLVFKRYGYYWRHPGADLQFASFEVDMETKTVKSIYLNDALFEPKIKPAVNLPP
jgi:hypothetical protein